MGLSIEQLEYFLVNSENLKSRRVGMVSVLFPPPWKFQEVLFKSYARIITQEYFFKLKYADKKDFSKIFFLDVLKARCLDIFDISNEEGAGLLVNWNLPLDRWTSAGVDSISRMLYYDFIVDGGTMEHIFDNRQYMSNVYSLLKIGGYYVASVPANNYLEHGFYQFSPTYFADLTYSNRSLLASEVLKITLHRHKACLLEFYGMKTDILTNDTLVAPQPRLVEGRSERWGVLTGTFIALANVSGAPSKIEWVVRKISSGVLSFDCIQREYRMNNLAAVNSSDPSGDSGWRYARLFEKRVLVSFIKRFFIRASFPCFFKLTALRLFRFVLNYK